MFDDDLVVLGPKVDRMARCIDYQGILQIIDKIGFDYVLGYVSFCSV